MKTTDARSLPPAAQEDLRRKAVNAVRDGKSQSEAARLFGVSRQRVNYWLRQFNQGGAAALKSKKRGRKPGTRLKPWQAATVVRLIKDQCPDQLHLPFYLWTRGAVQALIRRRFKVKVSVWTVGRYLRRWGFTPQKPARRALEQDDAAVKQWLKREYPAIRRAAKREKAEIYWGDEMGLRSDHAAGRSFGKRGRTPVVPGTGRRFGCSMISAITNRGRLNFMVFRERFRVDVFADFMKRLVRQAKGKAFLIVDGHPVHRSRRAKRWLKANAHRIRLFFLPGYSPELNPDEVLNQDVKTNAVGRRRARTQSELMTHLRGYLRSRQKQPRIVKSYFTEKHVRYAAM